MTYPFTFATESGTQPASQLDTMFNIAGQQGDIPCTATGTNTITLTPQTNYYAPAAYTPFQGVTFAAAATSTGAVTAQIGGLAFLKVFMPSGIQAQSGDIVVNTNYFAKMCPNLDGGNGGFQIINGTTATAVASPLGGSFKKLKLITTSDTTLTPTADEIIVENAAGGTVRLRSIAPSVTSTASVGTANGIVGAVAINTWYAFWFIFNPLLAISASNPAGWLDTNFTTPTPPAGYTYWMRAGAFLTDAAGKLNRTIQQGRDAQFIAGGAGATTPVLPQMVVGVHGTNATTTPPTLFSFSVSGFVPPTASKIKVAVWANGALGACLLAPNASYDGTDSAVNPAPFTMRLTAGAQTYSNNMVGEIVLESTNLFWATNLATAGVSCFGWTDNL